MLQIEDGLVVSMYNGCTNDGTDMRTRAPYWIVDAMECVQKTPVMEFMRTIRPFSVIDYDADHDTVFAPDQASGRKFVRKR